jgi:hypothetical protein
MTVLAEVQRLCIPSLGIGPARRRSGRPAYKQVITSLKTQVDTRLSREWLAGVVEQHSDLGLVDIECQRGGFEYATGKLVAGAGAGARTDDVAHFGGPPSVVVAFDGRDERAHVRTATVV